MDPTAWRLVMLIHRAGKWAIILLVVTTTVVVWLDLYNHPQHPVDASSPLSEGAAHLESIPSSENVFENEDWSHAGAELALLEEDSHDSASINLMLEEQDSTSPALDSLVLQTERVRPNVLPEAGSVPAVPLLSPQQRKANTEAIRKVHPGATDEQIEFWLEETRGLPPEMIQEMLRLRDQIGPLTEGFDLSSPQEKPESIATENSTLRTLHEARKIVLENLANSETLGYLRTEVHFVDQVSEASRRDLTIGERFLDTAPGRILETSESLDIAVSNSLFFLVVENGREYVTRFGHLKLGVDRRLMLAIDGTEIVVSPGNIIVPDGEEVQISTRGDVYSRADEMREWVSLGQLRIVYIANPKYLTAVGNALYVPTARSGKPIPVKNEDRTDAIKTGALELSNVKWDREQQLLKRLDWLIEQHER